MHCCDPNIFNKTQQSISNEPLSNIPIFYRRIIIHEKSGTITASILNAKETQVFDSEPWLPRLQTSGGRP